MHVFPMLYSFTIIYKAIFPEAKYQYVSATWQKHILILKKMHPIWQHLEKYGPAANVSENTFPCFSKALNHSVTQTRRSSSFLVEHFNDYIAVVN